MHPLIISVIIILSIDLLRDTIAVTYYEFTNRTNSRHYSKRVDSALYKLWLLTLIILGTTTY